MSRAKIRVQLDNGAFEIERAHNTDAGYDIKTPIDCVVPARGSLVLNTGVHIEIPPKYVGFLKSKSGLNVKGGLTGEGVIDSGYTGAIIVKLYNHGFTDYEFKAGDKVIQIVLLPIFTPQIEYVNELETTDRGDKGFGSTGK